MPQGHFSKYGTISQPVLIDDAFFEDLGRFLKLLCNDQLAIAKLECGSTEEQAVEIIDGGTPEGMHDYVASSHRDSLQRAKTVTYRIGFDADYSINTDSVEEVREALKYDPNLPYSLTIKSGSMSYVAIDVTFINFKETVKYYLLGQ